MILNVSGRCDIVAFYSDWFMNRYQEGFVDVRNPFYPKQVSRIYFKDVDAILFCTKNPLPILKDLPKIQKPILFHVTLTPYKKEIEPNVPIKTDVIEAIKKLSLLLGKDRVVVRYDPIFLSRRYSLEYHIRAFERMCSLLKGYVLTIIVSFLDDYQNVRKNQSILQFLNFYEEDYQRLGTSFSEIAKRNGIHVQTCFEERNLVEYGFVKGECLSFALAYQLTGKQNFKRWTARKGKKCHCVSMVDIGVYNSCRHFCKYCYANYDERKVRQNCLEHHPTSSLLVGELEKDDVITVRK